MNLHQENVASNKLIIGIAADHGGFELKQQLKAFLEECNFQVVDFGTKVFNSDDDYPDMVIPLARAIASGSVDRGIAICGSGVGACIAANKIRGIRAALISEHFSAHQGVEDDDMNLMCLGGRVTAYESAKELVSTFLEAQFSSAERHIRRLRKIKNLEDQ